MKKLSPVFNFNINQTFQGGVTDTATLDEASPGLHVQAGETLPPFYVLYCELDIPSLPEQAIAFHDHLDTLGYDVELAYLEGYTHKSEMVAIANSEETVTQLIVAYIKAHVIDKVVYLPLIVRDSTP